MQTTPQLSEISSPAPRLFASCWVFAAAFAGWLAAAAIAEVTPRYQPDARAAMVALGRYLDVTAAPFNADPTGQRDSTEPIRRAIAAARAQVKADGARRKAVRGSDGARGYDAGPVRANATLYFPAGTYRVTGPLVLADNIPDARLLHIVGEDRDRTVIRLDDRSPGFDDPRSPLVLVNFLDSDWSNSAFCNSVEGITIDVGAGNPGAIALRYHNNNVGYVRDVTLRSGDPGGLGHTGLEVSQHLAGIALFQDVEIVGFDHGVRTASHHVNLTFERLVLRAQRVAGITNADKSLSIRHLVSDNRVPTIVNTTPAGQVVVIDSELLGGAVDAVAIDNRAGQAVVRDVTVSGYGVTIRDRGVDAASAATIDFYATDGVLTVGDDTAAEPMRLPIRETPVIPWDDPADWAVVDGAAQLDDTAAIQAAIDSGARTVVLSQDHYLTSDTIELRGNVERVFGNWSTVHPLTDFGWESKPIFRFVDQPDGPDTVVFEQFDTNWNYSPAVWWFQHDASRTLVIRDVFFGYGSGAYRNTGTGDLFLEDVCHAGGGTMRSSPAWVFSGQRVWARQFNTEAYYPHVVVDDADVWILGYKVGEYHGPYFVVRNGGRLEALGGVFNSLVEGGHKPDRALISVDHAEAAVTGVERSTERQGEPHPVIASVRLGDDESVLLATDAPKRGPGSKQDVFGAAIPLVYAGGARTEGLPTVALIPTATDAEVVEVREHVATLTVEPGVAPPAAVRLAATVDGGEPVEFDVGVLAAGDAIEVAPPLALFNGVPGAARVELSIVDRPDYRVAPGSRAMTTTIASDAVDLDRGLVSRLEIVNGEVTDAVAPHRRLEAMGVTAATDGVMGEVSRFGPSGGVQMAWPMDLSSPEAKRGSVHGIQFDLRPFPPADAFMHDRVFDATVAAWVRPDRTDRPQVVFDRGNRRFGLAMRVAEGHVEAGVGVMGRQFVVREPIEAGAWTHVAMTFNRGRVRLYVNAEPVGTTAVSPGYRGFQHIDYQDSAGGWGRAWGGDVFASPAPAGFVGNIDEALIYDRVLTPDEVRELASRQSRSGGSPIDVGLGG